MSQYRIPSEKSPYYVPKEVYLTVVHYCLQYPLWKAELETTDGIQAIRYDKERVQTSPSADAVHNTAARRLELEKKKETLEEVARRVAHDMDKWLILGVCYGMTYWQLQYRGIPCGKDLYYSIRKKFYFEMSKEI